MQKNILFTFLLLYTHCQPDQSPRVSHLNLLLPQIFHDSASRNISTTISAYNGCYEWTSSHPDILKIHQENQQCVDQVQVQMVGNQGFQNIIWITARDKSKGEQIRIESKVQRVHKIEILTKLRTVDVGDVQLLELQGYDSEGNVFTTLEGLKFTWEIVQKQKSSDFVKFKDSNVLTSQNRKHLESLGHQTDNILIYGLSTGYSTIKVRLNEQGYQNVETEVRLAIVEHFQVVPDQNIYIGEQMEFGFQVFVQKGQNQQVKYEKVQLPSINYKFHNNQTSLCDVQQNGKFRSKDKKGIAVLQISDTRIENNYQLFDVHIVDPFSLEIEVSEFENQWTKDQFGQEKQEFDQNWNFIEKRQYFLKVNVKEKQNHNLIITNNMKFQITLDDSYLEKVDQKNNEFQIKSLKAGEKIKLSIELLVNSKPVLTTIKYVTIQTQIHSVDPSLFIHLPFKPQLAQQPYKIDVFGGSSYYEFGSQNPGVFQVSTQGILTPVNIGKSVIYFNLKLLEIRDQKNNKNKVIIEVYITEVTKIQFNEHIKEIGTNNTQMGFITSFGVINDTFQKYSNCSTLIFNFQNSNLEVKRINLNLINQIQKAQKENPFLPKNPELYKDNQNLHKRSLEYNNFGICAQYEIQSKQIPGEFQIQANLYQNKDEQKVNVYENLKSIDPQIKEVLVAFGSTFSWEVKNGPKMYNNQNERIQGREQLKSVNVEEKGENITNHILQIKNTKDKSYQIQCQYHSDLSSKFSYKVLLEVQNQADSKLQLPFKSSISLLIRCEHPNSVQLSVSHPDYVQQPLIHLKNQEKYQMLVQPYDQQGNVFYSYDSISFQFLANSKSRYEMNGEGNKREVMFENVVDYFLLDVLANQYNNQQKFTDIKDQLKFFVQNQVKFEKRNSLLYLSPKSFVNISIFPGSLHYNFHSSQSSTQLSFNSSLLTIRSSKQGTSTIFVKDLLQLNSKEQSMTLSVQPARYIKIYTDQHLYLQGSQIKIRVDVYDEQHNLFENQQYQFMNIQLDDQRQKLQFQQSSDIIFAAQANKVGDFKVQAKIDDVLSNFIDIHIYPELKSNYEEVFLAPGCLTYLQLSGGPSEKQINQYDIQFESQVTESKPISVKFQSYNLLEINAKELGLSTITFTYTSQAQQKSVLHQLKVNVNVELIKAIELPSKQVHRRSTVRVIPQFRLSTNYLTLSLCPFTYNWKSDSPILKLASDPSHYSLNLTALETGHSTLSLTTTLNYPSPYKKSELNSQSSIKVTNQLSLELNSYINEPVNYNLNLILPNNIIYKPQIHNNIRINSLSDNLIITDSQIQTLKNGQGLIQLSNEEESTKQNVWVTDVDSLFVENTNLLLQIPMDFVQRHRVYLLDQNGQLFPEQIYGLQYQFNILNPLIADVEINDNSLIIKGRKKGTTLFELTLQDTQTKDVFQITVGGTLSPQLIQIHEGGIIQFQDERQQYNWVSLNPNLISIDYRSGKAQAFKQGTAIIQYKDTQEFNITVKIQKINQLKTQIHEILHPEEKAFSIPFSVYSNHDEITTFTKHEIIDNGLTFECVSDNQWLSFTPEIKTEGERQRLFCKVEYRGMQPYIELPRSIKINVVVKSVQTEFRYEQSFEMAIVWGIVTDLDKDELRLTNLNQKKEIKIRSLHDLNIKCSSPYLTPSYNKILNLKLIMIDIPESAHDFYGICDIHCPLTSTHKKIAITYHPESYSFNLGDYLQLGFAAFLVIVTIVYFYGKRASEVQPRRYGIQRTGILTGGEGSYKQGQNLNLLRTIS